MDWFAGKKDAIAGKNSQRYQPPSFDEILYMDEEVIKPILEYQASFASGASSPDELPILASAAAMLGYELIDYTYEVTKERYLILREKIRESESRRTRKPEDQKTRKRENRKTKCEARDRRHQIRNTKCSPLINHHSPVAGRQ